MKKEIKVGVLGYTELKDLVSNSFCKGIVLAKRSDGGGFVFGEARFLHFPDYAPGLYIRDFLKTRDSDCYYLVDSTTAICFNPYFYNPIGYNPTASFDYVIKALNFCRILDFDKVDSFINQCLVENLDSINCYKPSYFFKDVFLSNLNKR